MNKIIRKAILLGVGAAALTKEKAEKRVKKFVKDGKISTKEGKELVKSILGEAKKEGSRIESLVKTEGKKLAKEADGIIRKEIKTLKDRIKKLEQKIKN